jgi:hypothetical protein
MTLLVFTILGLLVIGISVLVGRRCLPGAGVRTTIVSQGPTLEKLERLAHLVTTRVYVADVLTGSDGRFRGAWLIKGDAIIGVDMREARIHERDEVAKTAVIQVPRPKVLQSRVDHERTKTWEVIRKSWRAWGGNPDSLRDEVMLQAQKLVAQAAESEDNIDQAKTSTEGVIQDFYQEVGWQVRITWSMDSIGRQTAMVDSAS